MAKKRERIRQCRQIRELIEENKYTKALEMIDELPLEEVGSLDDLYLYAELYEKAGRMEKKKEIYYLIFSRTKSRHVLNKLLRLVIRLGHLEEARDLYFSYEVMGGASLDLYELRYLLAKAEGEPRSRLIEILEDLKKEEYTEEWGFQLARLYEQEGMRDKCIRECKDLRLWFGEGSIIDKVNELQRRCEAPGWKPPAEDEIPDEVIAETKAGKPADEEPEEGQPPEEEPEEKQPPEEESEKGQPPEEESEKADEELRKPKPLPQRKDEAPDEDPEDISDRGIHYRTLKSTIYRVRHGEEEPHFVFAGGEERITLTVAKRIAKELNHAGHVSAHSIVKITAEKLNQIDLSTQLDKLKGGCMLVMDAPELNVKAVNDLLGLLKEHGRSVVVMLSGPFDEMDCFLDIYQELSGHLNYKIRL